MSEIIIFYFLATAAGQHLPHEDTTEWQSFQMSTVHEDKELGDWHHVKWHTLSQLRKGRVI